MAQLVRVDVTGLRGITRALKDGPAVYGQAMEKVLRSTNSAGHKRIAAFVPARSGALGGALRERYFDARGPRLPQTGSVGTSTGVTDGGFRYGWALNFARKIKGTTADGYRYSAQGTGISASRAGQSTRGWISRAIPTMKSVIRRSVAKATRDIEAHVAMRARMP